MAKTVLSMWAECFRVAARFDKEEYNATEILQQKLFAVVTDHEAAALKAASLIRNNLELADQVHMTGCWMHKLHNAGRGLLGEEKWMRNMWASLEATHGVRRAVAGFQGGNARDGATGATQLTCTLGKLFCGTGRFAGMYDKYMRWITEATIVPNGSLGGRITRDEADILRASCPRKPMSARYGKMLEDSGGVLKSWEYLKAFFKDFTEANPSHSPLVDHARDLLECDVVRMELVVQVLTWNQVLAPGVRSKAYAGDSFAAYEEMGNVTQLYLRLLAREPSLFYEAERLPWPGTAPDLAGVEYARSIAQRYEDHNKVVLHAILKCCAKNIGNTLARFRRYDEVIERGDDLDVDDIELLDQCSGSNDACESYFSHVESITSRRPNANISVVLGVLSFRLSGGVRRLTSCVTPHGMQVARGLARTSFLSKALLHERMVRESLVARGGAREEHDGVECVNLRRVVPCQHEGVDLCLFTQAIKEWGERENVDLPCTRQGFIKKDALKTAMDGLGSVPRPGQLVLQGSVQGDYDSFASYVQGEYDARVGDLTRDQLIVVAYRALYQMRKVRDALRLERDALRLDDVGEDPSLQDEEGAVPVTQVVYSAGPSSQRRTQPIPASGIEALLQTSGLSFPCDDCREHGNSGDSCRYGNGQSGRRRNTDCATRLFLLRNGRQ